MNIKPKEIAGSLAIAVLLSLSSCQSAAENNPPFAEPQPTVAYIEPKPEPPASPFPNLQAEILDTRNKETNSPLGQFDFKNFTYPLPRGWQNPDQSDLTLTNGRIVPVSAAIDEEMSDDEKIERRSQRRIGMSYMTTKFLDVTGDALDEAIVILTVETTGAAIPQFVYIYEWKEDKPELLWYFRTGDRADGGLKDLRFENGEFVVELYGQDRFLLGEVETGKITGDEEQLCCPIFFTRTTYKWNGSNFQMQKARLTYSITDPTSPPVDKMGDIVNAKEKSKK
ncbi:MAG: hypothetical protein H7070_14495 [Saprospiraceae bacterium]|nr:hypothetical protein [Pyrinomonadaceae bacterium]